MVPSAAALSTQSIAEFLAAVSAAPDAAAATQVAAERAARALECEVGVVLGHDGVVSSVGFPAGRLPLADIVEIANRRKDTIEVPGAGTCHTVIVPLAGGSSGHLLVARSGEDGFSVDEISLVRSMGRVLDLTLGTMRTSEARQRAREELDRIFLLSPALICSIGFDGYFRRVNPAFERTLGYSTAELLERPFIDFVHPEDRERTAAEAEVLSHGHETMNFQNRYRCKSGSLRWLEWSGLGVPEQGLIYASARDVTERKHFEAERERREVTLRRSQEQLARLYTEYRRVANEQAALRRVATLVARGAPPDLVFTAVAEEVATLFCADNTTITRFEPDGQATFMGGYPLRRPQRDAHARLDPRSAVYAVQATGCAARHDVDHTSRAAPPGTVPDVACSTVASPIVVEDRIWGAIGVAAGREQLPPDTESRLGDFTELVATAIANAESRTELTTSRARIVAAADQTRRRIERDLHDGAQQQLVTLALQLREIQAALPPDLGAIGARLDRAVVEATGALEGLREIAQGIHPAILTEGGLRPALRTLARRSPIPVDLTMRNHVRLPEHVEVSTYYVVAEALTNAAKHAHASAVSVTVDADADADDGVLRVAVRDDGVGGACFTRGTGLLGLSDRVEALGGRIQLHSPRGEGTTLRMELPIKAVDGDLACHHLAGPRAAVPTAEPAEH
ncbi:PAS domain S-box protein [Dactylosporangium aurantiacum]|uniref:histidine kinase n=1 Tax=Dactylosporangium aurantiacum TaxID=35754 RepID=A0A9Q9MF84_9ACTN|nr:PAS domain S-box protein [Dactylosporangium aurantiacum]MDG6101887.1 PAS domain S-box protein [Dactylosporangium aurantiacum]UWZ52315.1 PAS domain S-box protein [Dactylosporangium aurantiacum]